MTDRLGPLDGIFAIDLTQAMAGPFCNMILGDLGADVIKVEVPGSGDQSRTWGPPFQEGESAYFMGVNRNKRSIALNLKAEGGRQVIHRLVRKADVLVTNTPREAQRQANGIDWQTLHELNPRLIYCLISGYGATGPYANMPGYDLIAQGLSGLMSITGESGTPPLRSPVPIADLITALYGVVAVEAALIARERTGQGQFVDLSLQGCQLAWLADVAASYFATGNLPHKLGNAHRSIVPYAVFRARDGYLIICAGTQNLWHRVCVALDAPQLEQDHRFATNADRSLHRDELMELLNGILGREDTAYWVAKLQGVEVPCGPVLNVAQALEHPQILHRGMVVEQQHPRAGTIHSLGNPIRFSETPVRYSAPPPLLGQHTQDVLRWLGYDAAEIERLRAENAI